MTGLLPAVLPMVRDGLALTYLQSGLALSAFNVSSGISQLPGGWLADRLNRGKFIAIGLTGVALAALAVGLSSSYYAMLVIMVMLGIFSGAYHPSAVPLLFTQVDEAKRGKAVAFHMVGGSIGFAIGPLLGAVIAETLGWQWSYVLLALPVLVAVPLVLKRFGRPAPAASVASASHSSVATTPDPPAPRIGLLRALKPIAAISVLVVLSQFVTATVIAFIPIYLVDKFRVSPTDAVFWLGIIRAFGIVGSLLGGWLSDKWGRRTAVYFSLIMMGAFTYILAVLPFGPLLMIVLILFGVLNVMRQATFQPYLLADVPPYLSATIFGIYFGLGMEGTSLVQPLAGYFMDLYGIASTFHGIGIISVGLALVTLAAAKLPGWRRVKAGPA